MTIRVLVVDDEELLASSLVALLNLEDDLEAVATQSAKQALTKVRSADVILIDQEMPEIDGLTAIPMLLEACPTARAIMMTRHAAPGTVKRALAAGAQGFAAKAMPVSELAGVVRRVHDGKRWVDPELATAALDEECPLTDRELTMLRHTLDGLTADDIAERESLAEGTVRNYLSSAIGKTGSETKYQAALWAAERGWL